MGVWPRVKEQFFSGVGAILVSGCLGLVDLVAIFFFVSL